MQTLNIHRPDMPELQFVLLVTALCTSRLTALNIPDTLRAAMFDRCWVLIHDSPPPRRPEARVLDLASWTELTVEAMAETIRTGLVEAGINTLAWDDRPRDQTCSSTPQAQAAIEPPYPSASETNKEASGDLKHNSQTWRCPNTIDAQRLLGQMATFISALAPALKRRAEQLSAQGATGQLVDQLLEGADVMQGSGVLYLALARHYIKLADGASDTTDDAGDGPVA